ncbi:hypothetical protein [Streptomyces achromogenes]|uniref:hypothetical protein n=1 Tax=Streptomyces achromogenes TaxID=67255 RepID=UPI0036F732E2
MLRSLEDEVAETRWFSGRGRAKVPVLAVVVCRYFGKREGFPLLYGHCLVLNRVQRRGEDGEPVGRSGHPPSVGNAVAAGTLYTGRGVCGAGAGDGRSGR